MQVRMRLKHGAKQMAYNSLAHGVNVLVCGSSHVSTRLTPKNTTTATCVSIPWLVLHVAPLASIVAAVTSKIRRCQKTKMSVMQVLVNEMKRTKMNDSHDFC